MEFESLQGLIPYDEAREYQLRLVEKRASDKISDRILFLEHEPVVTQGRGLQRTSSRPAGQNFKAPVLPPEISFAQSERGGDLTYHGPGQLVVYPIIKLRDHDVEGFLRKLEAILISIIESYGLEARRKEDATGVWVGTKKVASIGLAVKRWVTYHGIALNMVNDMHPFSYFQPCGFQSSVMSSLKILLEEKGLGLNANWREGLESKFKSAFGPQQSRLFETPAHS